MQTLTARFRQVSHLI